MSIPTNEPNPFGYDATPAPPGQAPLPGTLGAAGHLAAAGAPGVGYPATPEQSFPTQTAPVVGAEAAQGQTGSPYAPGGGVAGSGSAPMPPAYNYGSGYGYGSPMARPAATSSVAIVAICLFWLPLVGLVLSIVGLVKTGRGKARGRGLAVAALVLSILATAGSGLVGAVIASKPSVLDEGCRIGKSAVLDQSKKIEADSKKGDLTAVQDDLDTLVTQLAKAVGDAHRSDVRSAVQAVHDDYAALQSGSGDQSKLSTDLQQMDHLCTYGK